MIGRGTKEWNKSIAPGTDPAQTSASGNEFGP
jgi:hypothetical protein